MAQDNREKYAYLDRLSTQRLEELLLAAMEDDSGRDTSEAVLHILEVLQKREDGLTAEPVDVDRAWKEFQRDYLTPEGEGQALYPCGEDRPESAKKPKARRVPVWRTLRIAAATVALLFALMVGAQASGLNVFGALAQWTSETFRFGAKSEIQSENYQLFLDELNKNKIPKEFAPTWLPPGFVASEPIVKNDDESISILVSFSNTQGNTFNINVERYSSQSYLENNLFEKDDVSTESYLSQGKTFYIFSNIDSTLATWSEDTLLEMIWGDLSEKDIKAIIDSIGGS